MILLLLKDFVAHLIALWKAYLLSISKIYKVNSLSEDLLVFLCGQCWPLFYPHFSYREIVWKETILQHVDFHSVVNRLHILQRWLSWTAVFNSWSEGLDEDLLCHSGGDKINSASSLWEWEKEAGHLDVENKELGSWARRFWLSHNSKL